MIGKYELNNIYNEDSYKAIKDIPDKSVDCVYVDVPYLYDSGGGGSSALSKRITKADKELRDANIVSGFDYCILEELVRVSRKINIFVWCSKLQLLDIMNWFDKNTDTFFEILTWNKVNPTPATNNTWLPDIEYCLYFREKGVVLNDGYHLKSKFYTSPINKRDKDLFNHPTIKPLDLVKRRLEHTTQPNDIVADFFMGSGTTAVAAKELDRQFIGFELNKEYHKIAVDRVNGISANGQTSIFTDFNEMDGLEI